VGPRVGLAVLSEKKKNSYPYGKSNLGRPAHSLVKFCHRVLRNE